MVERVRNGPHMDRDAGGAEAGAAGNARAAPARVTVFVSCAAAIPAKDAAAGFWDIAGQARIWMER
ncbi:hypothetical protein AVXHC19_19030 [Acidovorax sacchari]